MEDEEKTKEQLLNELVEMRQRIAKLQASEIQHRHSEEVIERLRRQNELKEACTGRL
ncbi:MAG: hypothetical protein ACOYU0_04055 [Nitrospirota bacterium]